MSALADHGPSKLLELPSTWLAGLVQHVASGAGGLASAAALSQACKSFNALSESSAVTYRNLHLGKPLNSLDHPFFRWLAKRHSRVVGLTAELRLLTVGGPETGPEQLQVMFGIPGLHLTLRCDEVVCTPDDPVMTKVLKPHGHLVDHLDAIVSIEGGGLKLQDFCQAAAPCRSLDLTVRVYSVEPVNMCALHRVTGSLVRLSMKSTSLFVHQLCESVSSLSSFSHLSRLSLNGFDFGAEEPWVHLVGLTMLKQLSLEVAASGDPSSLSALTGLSSLVLCSYPAVGGAVVQGGLLIPCTFSSLQPLSTLQQLVELVLQDKACSATSLLGLTELKMLEILSIDAPMLRSLEGISTGLTSLTIASAPQLDSLAGVEHLQGLVGLDVLGSGVTSLHPLAALGSLESLCIGGTFSSLAGLEGNLCTCLQRLCLQSCGQLRQLSGIEGLTALQRLWVYACRVTSLQPVGQLMGGLTQFSVHNCGMVQEEVLELPHIQSAANVIINFSNVKEVVLAGGVRRRVDTEI